MKIYMINKSNGEPFYPMTVSKAVKVLGGGTLDEELEQIAQRLPVSDEYAGRYWDEENATPTAAGVAGSVEMLRNIPKLLGLGRYLVTDDRMRRKLDPADSTKFEDGTDAAVDGTMGQCMWCWNAHYYNTRTIGSKTYEAISFKALPGWESHYIPAGGISWFNAGVVDRTDLKLCSVISNDERYRGGQGQVVADTYTELPADAPQKTMIGMPATFLSIRNFGIYARKIGEGWEANWFVARSVVEYLFRIIMGTRNSQSDFIAEMDANGLYQGGLGAGVTEMPNWRNYNEYFPIIPTSVGLDVGDMVGCVIYNIPNADYSTKYAASVPVFFGLVNPYGHLSTVSRGVVVDLYNEKMHGYIAPSMYKEFDGTNTEGMLLATELSTQDGFIKKWSTHMLCGLPTQTGGSAETHYADYYWAGETQANRFRCRLAGGNGDDRANAGIHRSNVSYASETYYHSRVTLPLCYFEEDPIISE